MTEAIVAIDLGTSATKLLVVNREGSIIARHRVTHATSHPVPDAAEQDPDEWWSNLSSATCQILAALSSSTSVQAVGVTGQMHGLVVHDDAGATKPAITWQDRRSAHTVPDLVKPLSREHAESIAPGYQAASWHWLTRTSADVVAMTQRILLPKDDVIYRLTGEHVTDPSDAIGTGWFDIASGSWDPLVLQAAGASIELLPEVRPSGSVAGRLTPTAGRALGVASGIPVVIAGGDAAVGAFGAGATDPATPLVMLSTGCQILQPSNSNDGQRTWPSANPAGLPRWLRVATTLNGGNVVSWARSTFGDINTEPPDDLTFLPYLAGERSDRIAPDAAGAFLGLREHHARGDMAGAVIDGVALAVADAFETIGGEIATDAPILVGGGGVRDDAWVAALVRVFARPIQVIDEADLSVWGAARSAATALGWIDPVADPGAWRPTYRTRYPVSTDAASALSRLRRFQDHSRRLFGSPSLHTP